MSHANWNYPTAVRFGPGRVVELPELCQAHGITKPLVVTDPGLARLPLVDRVVDPLRKSGLRPSVFSEVDPNPVGTNVERGVEAYRAGGHDGVIALGGGSGLDAGKAIALMSGQHRPMWDFEDVGDNHLRVDPNGIAKTIAVPTTAGTGSEVGRSSVITHEGEKRKVIVFHADMLPVAALLDPELTVGLPPKLTAATGMDALSHCLEAYCAPGYHPQADGIALEGMRLVRRALLRAHTDGTDIDARGDMLSASLMGATAFQKGLGAMHALSHPLGAQLNTHHGETNAVVMPYVLVRNRADVEARLKHLATVLDLPKSGFDGVLEWVLGLREALGIPHTLADLGMGEEHIETLAPMAAADPAGGGNPTALDVSDYAELYRSALHGRLESVEPA